MSTYTSEPGTRLAGRYRLVDQAVNGNGWTLWKAIDETLARPVAILTFASGFPRISEVVTAARAASRLTDPRMAQVFDVEDGGGQAYIVLEWVGGESLTELLDGNGPLDPAQACSIVCDAARALAGAHALGQAHLRLTPDTLRWSRGSGIKITGLGIDAALAGDGMTGAAVYDPAVADTCSLASLLYAALTGYWPGDEPTQLPPAPFSDGAVAAPRQVSADVSAALDSVITRALLQRPNRQGPAIQSPAEFADALAAVAPPAPLPEPAPAAAANYGYGSYGPDPNNPDTWGIDGRGPSGTAPYQPPSAAGYTGAQYPASGYQGAGKRRGQPMVMVIVVLLVVVVGVVVWAVGFNKSSPPTGSANSQASTSVSGAPAAGTVLAPANVLTFNPYGKPTPGNNENTASLKFTAGTDSPISWSTSYYYSRPDFGGLKPGTGLLIDLGKQVKLSQVEVTFSSGGGPTTAAIYLGNDDTDTTATALSNFTLVSPSASVSGDHKFPVSSNATGRYVLIWITNLPKLLKTPPGASAGITYYEAQISNVVVRGSAVSGNS
jgi:serine/threonine protein kinase